ncbi:DNA polymerase III alpha subunit [Alkalispirillum mobile]|uniref:DNA polymerase III subunit alpha n=1 Tax=Alkalispirillum mobile TaxID=85925 RepID=A0A498C517_9GAMM|nr:DNA polymerase III subunit alpha [Alkalispirillum mobile]RLK50712.1 DNA polymerase III alpha subunit [Alkalispirillum mobile]
MSAQSGFVHLNVHSEFSLSDGILRIPELVNTVGEQGMPAVAMTDQGNLFGMVKFYKQALGAGIKPIIGAEVRVQDDGCDTGHSALTLLCRDLDGYAALSRLISLSYQEGRTHDDTPVVHRDWLEADHEGLIVLSGGKDGDVGKALLAGNDQRAEALCRWYADLFPDAYYLELQRIGRPGDEDHLHAAVALAGRLAVPVVATNAVRFLAADDFDAHEVRVCIHDGYALDDPKRPRRYTDQQYLRSPEEMAALFSDLPEALENTVEIARRCSLDLTLGENVLPDFPIPEGLTIEEFLREESLRGLDWRLGLRGLAEGETEASVRETYLQRLDWELGIINQMGFPGYFLIVADFIRWAKEHDIPVGPGRGSGAGSLVAYALAITDLDPLRYDLLFERFLNPERVSMPDFDVDFCMEQRDDVIEYVAERYGRDKVSQIATHGTMAARAVVRDVGRVLGHGYGYVDRIAKLVPFEPGMQLTKAFELEPELKELYEKDDEAGPLLAMALKLEGLARNVGKHAGGVVIAPTPLTDFSPLYCEPGGEGLATQYDKDDVEEVGLVKFDFLGLRTLTIIDWTVKAVNALREQRGDDPLDIAQIPLDDRDTFTLLKRCQTTAVFQLESRGMKELIKRLQPDSFEDIVALVALFRPGPLQSGMVDDFIDRKHGRAQVAYPTPELHHDDLEPILKPTYGVILYQEQVMQIAQALAGYSLGAADLLRRAMGKKKAAEMAKQREIFLKGAQEHGLTEEHAGAIFDLMEKFAGYGFNKSHSAAYALLSYQTAWLKHHYPAPFMASVLSSDMDNTDKVVIFIEECREMDLRVEPPDVNRSGYRFRAADEHTIIYGLGAVKGVGQSALDAIIEERDANGPFQDLQDLCNRVDLRKVNRRVLEALCRSGSLDSLIPNRATGMAWLPEALAAAEQKTRNAAAGQDDLFGLPGDAEPAAEAAVPHFSTPEQPEWDEHDRLAAEKETLGLFLTGHPIDPYEAELPHLAERRIAQVLAAAGDPGEKPENGRRRNGPTVRVVGLVVAMRTRNTANGGRMASLALDDRTARMEAMLFPEAYERLRSLIAVDRVLVVEGKLDYDDFAGGWRITVEQLQDIADARADRLRRLVVGVTAGGAGNGFADALDEALRPYRQGRCEVQLDYHGEEASGRLRLGPDWRVHPSDELLRRLERLAGPEQVRLEY